MPTYPRPANLLATLEQHAKALARAKITGRINAAKTDRPLLNLKIQQKKDRANIVKEREAVLKYGMKIPQLQKRKVEATQANTLAGSTQTSDSIANDTQTELSKSLSEPHSVLSEASNNQSTKKVYTIAEDEAITVNRENIRITKGKRGSRSSLGPVTHHQITLIRSPIGLPHPKRKIVKALGLTTVNSAVIKNANPQTAGMIIQLKEILRIRNLRFQSNNDIREYVKVRREMRKPDPGYVVVNKKYTLAEQNGETKRLRSIKC